MRMARLAILAAAALAGAAPAGAQTWEFKTITIDGGARSGTVRQAQNVSRTGAMVIVACAYDGRPFLSYVPTGFDPDRHEARIPLEASVRRDDGNRTFQLSWLSYSLGAYSAPVSREFVAAVASGSQLVLSGIGDDHAADTFQLRGSGRAIAQLDCL